MNFVAIDFETAHGNMPCEIGVCVVRNGVVSETKSWLIKPQCFPYMNRWNQQVHGISSDMVKDAETFDTLWYSQIRDYINKELIVAHNAPFDIGEYRDWETDRKSTRLNSSHSGESRMPSSA